MNHWGILDRKIGTLGDATMLVLAVFFGLCLWVPTTAAQTTDAQLRALLKKGQNQYDELQLAKAEQTLSNAVSRIKQKGLSSSVAAEVYVMLGVVRYARTRDKARAREVFKRAVRIDRSVEIDRMYSTPVLSDLMEEAREAVPDKPRASDSNKQDSEPTGPVLRHTPVRKANVGRKLTFEVDVSDQRTVERVFLYYRRFDEQAFSKEKFEKTNGSTYEVTLPASEVQSSQIDYYVEAEGRSGDRVGGTGTRSSPIEINVWGKKQSRQKADKSEQQQQSKAIGKDRETQEDKPEQNTAKTVETSASPPPESLGYVALTGGAGGAFLLEGPATANPDRKISPGVAPSLGHVSLEAGWQATPSVSVGLYFRWQMLPTQNFNLVPVESRAPKSGYNTRQECLGLGLSGDCLAGAKTRWAFYRANSVQLYMSGSLGLGRVRNWIRLQEPPESSRCDGKQIFQSSSGQRFCYLRDTVRSGWFHGSAGIGLDWPVTESFAITTEMQLRLLAPDTAFHLDADAGARFRF